MGDHPLSDHRTISANNPDHCAVEARLLQAQSSGSHALRKPGEEQPRVQPVHRERQEQYSIAGVFYGAPLKLFQW